MAVCGLTAPFAFAEEVTQYVVTVNTSSDVTGGGYIDFQFNPSTSPTQAATAEVTNFTSNGTLEPVDPYCPSPCYGGTFGEVSGTLPGTVTLINSETTNEYTEAMVFGTTITFDLDVFGPAVGSTANGDGGGTFTLDFLDAVSGDQLFTEDPLNDVQVFQVNINSNGSTSGATFLSTGGAPSVVTFSGPTQVPEPSAVLLLSGVLMAIGAFHRRRALKTGASSTKYARPAYSHLSASLGSTWVARRAGR